jgi:hypothetical protein
VLPSPRSAIPVLDIELCLHLLRSHFAMSQKTRRLMSLFGSSKSTETARQQARKRRGMRKLSMEPLEDRRLLAVLTESGSTLTIDLNVPGEEFKITSLTDLPAPLNAAYGLATSSSTFDFSSLPAGRIKTLGRGFAITRAGQAAYDTINIIDSAQDTRVVFAKSNTSAPWTENVTVTLDDDTSVAPGA